MSSFEFFFSFYGLLLGLSVAELVGGFARVLHEKDRIRFGLLTPLLAMFVAIEIGTFWNQAWVIFRGAPFNTSVLLIALIIAATFYVAASITFPRVSAEGGEDRIDLDDHFWARRRLVFSCILAANLIVAMVLLVLAQLDPGFAKLASSVRLWVGTGIFVICTATAAFTPWRRAVVAALVIVLLYSLWGVLNAASALIAAGGWAPALGAGG
ncbi:cation transport ATPase [Brevundimonas nasdae]|uniref:hypothetical protein n=1 Tax=Brevundimonas nasdae TaxID=172043 RepID=UPI0019148927|nr:hypothetical protein [Brevundimonas nasdae]MBK6025004.1 hypothetical protein [Brevundimonas nasdae]MDQ0451662.1 cation transport ATPase [Brevundimonas nasdae]